MFLFLAILEGALSFSLVWSDEFDQPLGSGPSSSKWTYDLGYLRTNDELEYYTNSRKNSFISSNRESTDGKVLVIRALKEVIHTGNITTNYTSARILTKGIFQFRYGKIECRAKVPKGQGLWPAFWTLGANIDKVGWPSCGEIDVMESINNASIIYGTVHGPGDTGIGVGGKLFTTPISSSDYSRKFHVYSVVWTPSSITFMVDSKTYFTVTKKMIPNMWAFDKPQFILLNLAVGGNWPRNPDPSTPFPSDYIIDYVRVSQ